MFGDDDTATPVVGLHGLGLPENGNFTGEVVAGKGAPTGWFTKAGTLNNNSEWTLDTDTPWSKPAGDIGMHSMRCEVSTQAIRGCL